MNTPCRYARRAILVAFVALSACSLAVSCRKPKADPLDTIVKKFAGGAGRDLAGYYQDATGIKLPVTGVVFDVDQADVQVVSDAIRSGYVNVMPFRLEKNYGHGGRKDKLAVIKAMDQFQLVADLGTSGKDDKVPNDFIVKGLRKINSLAEFRITGAGADFVEFTFKGTPKDWAGIAKACAACAPNIVTYGTGDLKTLEAELEQYGGAVLWWY